MVVGKYNEDIEGIGKQIKINWKNIPYIAV